MYAKMEVARQIALLSSRLNRDECSCCTKRELDIRDRGFSAFYPGLDGDSGIFPLSPIYTFFVSISVSFHVTARMTDTGVGSGKVGIFIGWVYNLISDPGILRECQYVRVVKEFDLKSNAFCARRFKSCCWR